MSNEKQLWDALNTGSVEAVAAEIAEHWPSNKLGGVERAPPLTEPITFTIGDAEEAAARAEAVDEAKERAEFEAWAIESGWAQQKNHLARNLEIDEYFNHIVEACWQGVLWRASRG